MTSEGRPEPNSEHRAAVGFTLFLALVLWLPGGSMDGLPGRFDHLLPEHIDKWIHGILFSIESRLLFRSLDRGPFRGRPRRAVGLTFILVVALAAITEAVQTFIPGRGPDPWDFGADTAGFFAWWTIHRLAESRDKIRAQ